jgi:hypothetical protein
MQFVRNTKALLSCHYPIGVIACKIVFLQSSKRFGWEHSLEMVYWEHSESTDVGVSMMSKTVTFARLNYVGEHGQREISLLLSVLRSAKIFLFGYFCKTLASLMVSYSHFLLFCWISDLGQKLSE